MFFFCAYYATYVVNQDEYIPFSRLFGHPSHFGPDTSHSEHQNSSQSVIVPFGAC